MLLGKVIKIVIKATIKDKDHRKTEQIVIKDNKIDEESNIWDEKESVE